VRSAIANRRHPLGSVNHPHRKGNGAVKIADAF